MIGYSAGKYLAVIDDVWHRRGVTRFRVTRSARKHKIGNARMLAAIANASEPVRIGDQLIYIGVDDRDRSTWVIIHAMPTQFRERS